MPPLPAVPPDRITITRPSPRTSPEIAVVQRRVIPWRRLLRLAGALALFGIALLTQVPAQFTTMWVAALVVTETAHWFALLAAAAGGAIAWRGGRRERVAAGVAFLAALIFAAPVMQALTTRHEVAAELTRAWGRPAPPVRTAAKPRPAPLVLRQLFLGVPAGAHGMRTLEYPRAGGSAQLDLYLPARGSGAAPLVVLVHGGSWSSGSRTDFPALAEYLAGHGYAVAMPDYRKAPAHPFPAARDDVLAATTWLRGRGAELGIDPSRVAFIGRSAGAQLAFSVADAMRGPAVRGVASLYGPLDLRWGYAHPGNPRVLAGRATLRAYLGGNPKDVPAAYDAASPIQHVDAASPPALLIHGARDELVSPEHAERFAARMEWAGRPHVLLSLPWATHGCDVVLSGPCGQIVVYSVERFLSGVMR